MHLMCWKKNVHDHKNDDHNDDWNEIIAHKIHLFMWKPQNYMNYKNRKFPWQMIWYNNQLQLIHDGHQ